MKLGKKLTPEQEAKNFDRERDRKSGNEPGLSTAKQNKIIQERLNNQKLRNENTQNSHLEKFDKFSEDPLKYLYDLVSQGEYSSNQDQRTELFTLMILVKIQNSLAEITASLSKRK